MNGSMVEQPLKSITVEMEIAYMLNNWKVTKCRGHYVSHSIWKAVLRYNSSNPVLRVSFHNTCNPLKDDYNIDDCNENILLTCETLCMHRIL